MNIKERKKGFTMVEIAVVLVIIGVILIMGLSAFRGVKNTSTHVQWQTLMNEAYDSLVRYVADYGYLPRDQAEFDVIFPKQVDDYSYGGKVLYSITNEVANIATNTDYIYGGRVCSLKRSDITEVNNKTILITLSEGSINRDDKLKEKEIQLQDLQAAIKCVQTTMPLRIATTSLPIYDVGSFYIAQIDAVGGKPFDTANYRFCAQILPNDNTKLKCSLNDNLLPNNFFNKSFGSPDVGDPNADKFITISIDCAGETVWKTADHAILQIDRGRIADTLSSGTLPIRIFASDSSARVANKDFSLTINEQRVKLATGCPTTPTTP